MHQGRNPAQVKERRKTQGGRMERQLLTTGNPVFSSKQLGSERTCSGASCPLGSNMQQSWAHGLLGDRDPGEVSWKEDK